MAHFQRYVSFERYPWELGYPHYIELQNIFPFMLREWHKRVKQETEAAMEYQRNIGR